MDRLDLHERIETHRDGETDALPAEREAVERRQRVLAYDAAVGAAMRKAPLPDGLKARIRQRIAVETADARLRRRRRLMYAGVGSALALSLCIGLSLWRWPDKSWTNLTVAAEAGHWYGRRFALQEPTDETPPLPRFGIRQGSVVGFGEIPFLKRNALAYRLESGGHQAVAIIVDAHWFPEGFSFTDVYVTMPDGAFLDVSFRRIDATDQWCVLIGERLSAFEEQSVIL